LKELLEYVVWIPGREATPPSNVSCITATPKARLEAFFSILIKYFSLFCSNDSKCSKTGTKRAEQV
jgi:hypothetical protein